MEKFELFDRRVDFLALAGAAATAIWLFYGFAAAFWCFVFILALSLLKPLQQQGFSRERLTLIGTAVVFTISPFFRSLWLDGYCSTAPWAVHEEMNEININMPCFIRGGYLQYVFEDTWRSVLRDVVLPLSGLTLLFYALPFPARRNGVSVATFLLLLGLFINAPLLKQSNLETSAAAATANVASRPYETAKPTRAQPTEAPPSRMKQEPNRPSLVLSTIPESEFEDHIGASCIFRMAKIEPLIVNLGWGRININGSSVNLAHVPDEWNDLVEGGTYFADSRKVTVTPAVKPDEVGYEMSVRSAVIRIDDGEKSITHKGKWQCGS